MEGLARLVSESMARHGMDCALDCRRLNWSRWYRCETVFDLLLVPSRPGLFAIAEELIGPDAGGRRMLAVLQVSATEDLAISLYRLFAPANPMKERLSAGRLFARFTVIEDAPQRLSAEAVFQRWLATSAEAASGVVNRSADVPAFPSPASEFEVRPAGVLSPAPLPGGF